jgi:hypothetical protein
MPEHFEWGVYSPARLRFGIALAALLQRYCLARDRRAGLGALAAVG